MSGSLTEEEVTALSQFRAAISDYVEKFDSYEAHDENLVRWVRAKDLNVPEAEEMFRASMKYREENNFARFRELPLSEFFLEKFSFRPAGFDKDGALIIIAPIMKWDLNLLTKVEHHDPLTTHIFHILDKCHNYLKANSTPENMKTQVVLIIDIEGFAVQDLLSTYILQYFSKLLDIYEAHSPERLKAAYVINISSFFSIFWPVLKPFIQTRTLSRVQIIGGGAYYWKPAILEAIPHRELPSEYGGTNTAHPEAYTNERGEEWPARAPTFPPEKFVTTVVAAGDKFVTGFDLSPGNRITWNFKTEFYDIGFSFTHNDKPMFPYARADAHVCVQDGCVDIVEPGTYSLVFDNTYSYYRPKTLHYAIEIQDKVESQE